MPLHLTSVSIHTTSLITSLISYHDQALYTDALIEPLVWLLKSELTCLECDDKTREVVDNSGNMEVNRVNGADRWTLMLGL